jgi:hypothetical protein
MHIFSEFTRTPHNSKSSPPLFFCNIGTWPLVVKDERMLLMFVLEKSSMWTLERVCPSVSAGMFVAAAIKELRQCVLPTMVFLVSHYTMVAISQQAGEYSSLYRNWCTSGRAWSSLSYVWEVANGCGIYYVIATFRNHIIYLNEVSGICCICSSHTVTMGSARTSHFLPYPQLRNISCHSIPPSCSCSILT